MEGKMKLNGGTEEEELIRAMVKDFESNPDEKEALLKRWTAFWRGFIAGRAHLISSTMLDNEPNIPNDIRDEMDCDMEEGGMSQGEIESCLIHWSNMYVIRKVK